MRNTKFYCFVAYVTLVSSLPFTRISKNVMWRSSVGWLFHVDRWRTASKISKGNETRVTFCSFSRVLTCLAWPAHVNGNGCAEKKKFLTTRVEKMCCLTSVRSTWWPILEKKNYKIKNYYLKKRKGWKYNGAMSLAGVLDDLTHMSVATNCHPFLDNDNYLFVSFYSQQTQDIHNIESENVK